MTPAPVTAYLKRQQRLVDEALRKRLPGARKSPQVIHRAMRYSVLGEGKRIRPILALAACEAAGGRARDALDAACALELIHAYSLVHDDLPAMDDDDLRRGRPSCHKRFGEAIGILTGDALLTYAFELLATPQPATPQSVRRTGRGVGTSYRSRENGGANLAVLREVARAIGTQGMIGGQVVDLALAAGRVRGGQVESVHARKTGALLAASVRVGALLGHADARTYRALCRYGERVGLTFQLVDDLLDQDGAVRYRGAEAVRRRAERLTREAVEAVRPLGGRAEPLRGLAEFILERSN